MRIVICLSALLLWPVFAHVASFDCRAAAKEADPAYPNGVWLAVPWLELRPYLAQSAPVDFVG